MTNKAFALALWPVFVVLLIQTQSAAQTRSTVDASLFRIGVRGGGNSVLPLEAVDNATYYPTVSFHGGLLVNIGRGMFTLQPEVNYSQRHIRADFNQSGASLSAKVMTTRLEVPLLVKATFGQSNARFFMNAGPYGAYVLGEQYRASLLSLGSLDPRFRPAVELAIANLNNKQATFTGSEGRISYGVAGGLGVALKTGPGHLTLEGRALYQLGDNMPANAPDPSGISLTSNLRNTKYMLLQASVSYIIPIGN